MTQRLATNCLPCNQVDKANILEKLYVLIIEINHTAIVVDIVDKKNALQQTNENKWKNVQAQLKHHKVQR